MKWHHERRRGRSGNNADGAPRAECTTRRPIAAWPLIAPTGQGLCAVAFAVALWYAALLMDEQTLVAAALAVSVAIIVDIVMIVAQWCGCRIWAEQVVSSRGSHRFVWRGVWWPRRARSALLYRAYDVDDRPIGPTLRAVPDKRGYYRCEYAVIRWRGPLGLCKARRALAGGVVTYVVPKASEAAGSTQAGARSRRNALQFNDEQSGMVRPYMSGDSMQRIVWHHTARYDDLMVRDSHAPRQGNIIIWLDASSAASSDGENDGNLLDALVSRAEMWTQRIPSHATIVTDGVVTAQTDEERIRLFACAGNNKVTDSANSADSSKSAKDAQIPESLRAVLADPQTTVVAISVNPEAASHVAEQCRIAQSRISADIIDMPTSLVPLEHISISQHQQSAQPQYSSSHKASSEQTRTESAYAGALMPEETRMHDILAAISTSCVAAVALYALFALTIAAAFTLIQPGTWTPFAYGIFAFVAIESAIPIGRGRDERHGCGRGRVSVGGKRGSTRNRRRLRVVLIACARCLVVALITLIAAITLINSLTMQHTGMWLVWPTDEQQQNAQIAQDTQTSQNPQDAQDTQAAQAPQSPQSMNWLQQASSTLTLGFEDLYRQLPPVQVSWRADIVCILVVTCAAIMMRLLLLCRACMPLMGLLPVISISASALLAGASPQWWWLAVMIAAWIVLLEAVRPCDAGVVLRGTAVIAVTALSLYAVPPMLQVAYGVPLSFGDSNGLLSSNMVNPVVDLKRSLVRGSSQIALRYNADAPQYLRLSTLGNFDGDTWRYDEPLTDAANLYGSGIRLGAGGDSGMVVSRDSATVFSNPWSMYYGLEVANSGAINDGEPIPFDAQVQGDVEIASLVSRFLPTFGLSNSVSNLNDQASRWNSYEDGSEYSRTSTTFDGMSYSVESLYMQPISDEAGFSRIDAVKQIYQRLLPQQQSIYKAWNERVTQRQQLIADSLAEQWDTVLAIPVNLDESAGVIRLRDGTVAATLEAESYSVKSAGGVTRTTYQYEFADDFLQRAYVGDDEWSVMVYASDGNDVLLLSMEEPQPSNPVGVGTSFGGSGNESSGAGAQPDAISDGENKERIYDIIQQHVPASIGVAWTPGNPITSHSAFFSRIVTSSNEYVRDNYSNLPSELPDHIQSFVNQAAKNGIRIKQASSSDEETSRQIAAMQYLVRFFTDPENGFAYTLHAPDGNGRNNMEVINDFLISRRGYCTHYATALAILGRAMNIPTRIVLGYSPNVTKDSDGWYQVSANRLHAWTEAYIENIGWVPFDVTPASSDDTSNNTTSQDSGDAVQTPATPDRNMQDDSSDDGTDVDMTITSDPNAPDTTQDDASPNAADADEPEEDAQSLADASAVSRWRVARIATAVSCAVFAALACALTPVIVRNWRRRRRHDVIVGASSSEGGEGDAGKAWRAAWHEVTDSAWDAGIRWQASDSDTDIAYAITQYCVQRNADVWHSQYGDDICVISAAAASAAFGSAPKVDDGLWDRVERVREALHISRIRQLFPASWRKSRKPLSY